MDQNAFLMKIFLCGTGLKIVYTHDEVDVVQNLIFYIESAYKVAVSTMMLFWYRKISCVFHEY